MEIKLLNVKDIDGLFKVIDSCEDKVELVGDDIRLNLKSKLSQYISLSKMLADDKIPELLTLRCMNSWRSNYESSFKYEI